MNSLFLIVCALTSAPQEKNEAEELFKKMEEKIEKAATVKLKTAGTADELKLTMSGDLIFGEAARLRIRLDGKMDDRKVYVRQVSDGKRLRVESNLKPKPKFFVVSDSFGRMARLSFARSGYFATIAQVGEEKGMEEDELFAVAAFKMGAKEKVGDREAQAVEYRLDKKNRPSSAATVWIDLETRLPLKRVLKEGEATFVETYSEFALDEKIDPAKFELPK